MKYTYEDYQKVKIEQNNIRDLIDGALNRISVTDDENERNNRVIEVNHLVLKYKDLSIECHKVWVGFNGGK